MNIQEEIKRIWEAQIKQYMDMEETLTRLTIVTGMSAEKIIDLFCEGYELIKPVEPPYGLEYVFQPLKRIKHVIKYLFTGRWE